MKMKKMLSEHKIMIRPSHIDAAVEEVKARDDQLMDHVLDNMATEIQHKVTDHDRASALLHMEDMLQFMMLRNQLREFKSQREENIREKLRYTDHIREDINRVISKQTHLKEKKAKLKERISRHFLMAGLLWFPVMPVLLGLSLMMGATFAPAFLVGILALGMTVVMGEKIVHDYQRKEALREDIEKVCSERSKLIRMYMQYRHEVKSLIEDQSYYIEKYGHRVSRNKDYFH